MSAALNTRKPSIPGSCYVAGNATVIGDVNIGDDSSVWFGAVVRGDSNAIRIGSRSNVQDLCVLHVDSANRLSLGDDVTVGHRVVLHGCSIGDRVLVGMGAVVMNGAVVGDDCIIAAGAVVTERAQIPPRSLVVGVPGKVKRELTDDEASHIVANAKHYVEYAKVYKTTSY